MAAEEVVPTDAPAAAAAVDRAQAAPVAEPAVVGTVTSPSGEPIAHASITVTDAHGRQTGRASVADDGSYALAGLEPGMYTVIATAADRAPRAVSVAVVDGAVLRRDFSLEGGAVLRGVVGDGVRNLPASVVVTDQQGEVVAQTKAGADGVFVLTGLSDGETVAVTATAPGYQPSSRLVTVDGRMTGPVEFGLTAHGNVQGYVRAIGGGLLAGATVSAIGPDQTIVAAVRTDSDGWYRIEGLDDARYTLVASMYEPQARQVSVAAGEQNNVDIELGTAAETL
ncbi:MSCRAMM family protein [Gordonia neofelifaecis]|nr:carboxypeptidase-like regulatory domain-containing protein [Gordonia neofelifaecis]